MNILSKNTCDFKVLIIQKVKLTWDSYLKSNSVRFGNLPFDVATLFLIKVMKSMADQTHLFSFGQITLVLTFQQIVFRIFYEREFGLVFTSDEP